MVAERVTRFAERAALELDVQALETAQDIDKGIGTLYVRDLDGNLYEFVQLGRGIYAEGGLEAMMRAVQDNVGQDKVRGEQTTR